MTEQAERNYRDAWNKWRKARTEYKKQLNRIALHQLEANDEHHRWDERFTAAFNDYHKVTSKYLKALKSYTAVRPEMRGRLMYDLLQQAAVAESVGQDRVAGQHHESISEVATENAKIAHKDWVKNQDKEHFAAVLLAIADAQLMAADDDADVIAISEEMCDLLEKGKVKRDMQPAPAVNNAPKIPSVNKPGPVKKPGRRESPLMLHRTLPWGPR